MQKEAEAKPARASERETAADPRKNNSRCFNCNGAGHIAADCKKEKRERGSCYTCGSSEHQILDCPKHATRAGKTAHLVQAASTGRESTPLPACSSVETDKSLDL